MARLDAAQLQALKHRGDAVADAIADQYLDHLEQPSKFFRATIAARYSSPDLMDDDVRNFLQQNPPPLPEWAAQARLRNGAEFFKEWGIQLGLGLFLQALPLAYASEEGVKVLALTSKLEKDTSRRVMESAQFVLDVTTPGALAPGQLGYDTARHIRLMHAGIRQLIRDDPRIPITTDPTVENRWDPQWGQPINQLHMLGAMLSYSSSLLHVLDLLGADYSEDGAADYCLLWNAVGWLLGVDETLLPLERHEMVELETAIQRMTHGKSTEGKLMTDSLIELVQGYIKIPGFKGLPITLMRLFIGDDVAELLGVPKAGWTRVLIRAKHGLGHGASRGSTGLRRRAVGWASTKILRGFVAHNRGPDRPKYTIPDHLELKVGRNPGKRRTTSLR